MKRFWIPNETRLTTETVRSTQSARSGDRRRTRFFLGALRLICCTAASLLATQVLAGNLTVNGNLTVTTNLTAESISLGGVTQTNLNFLPLQGYTYVIVPAGTNDVNRGDNLLAAYGTATTLNPTSSNRVVVLVPPGSYDLGTNTVIMNTSYVDLIGLVPAQMTTKTNFTDGSGIHHCETVANVQCPVVIYAGPYVGPVVQSVDNIRIESVILKATGTGAAYAFPVSMFSSVSYPNTVLRHVEAQSMTVDVYFEGLYIDCVGGNNCFGSGDSNISDTYASGTFIDCVAGDGSFGGDADDGQGDQGGSGGGEATGTFIGCTAGDYSFGAGNDNDGVFIDCVAGNESFGGEGGSVGGTLIDCVGSADCFGGDSGGQLDSSAKLQHCRASAGSFGGFSMASADFNYNVGGTNTFLMLPQLPTSTNGLPSGTVYNSSGSLKVMP